MERECVEERCSKEEAREVFENDPETVSVISKKLLAVPKHCLKLYYSVKVACRCQLPLKKHTTSYQASSPEALQYQKLCFQIIKTSLS